MRITILGCGDVGLALARHWSLDPALQLVLTTTRISRITRTIRSRCLCVGVPEPLISTGFWSKTIESEAGQECLAELDEILRIAVDAPDGAALRTGDQLNVKATADGSIPANLKIAGKAGDQIAVAVSDGTNNTDLSLRVGERHMEITGLRSELSTAAAERGGLIP
jgi:hypothetical protein